MNAWIELISEPIGTGPSGLDLVLPDTTMFTPLAVVCGVSLLLTALWTLGVWEYLWLKQHEKYRSS